MQPLWYRVGRPFSLFRLCQHTEFNVSLLNSHQPHSSLQHLESASDGQVTSILIIAALPWRTAGLNFSVSATLPSTTFSPPSFPSVVRKPKGVVSASVPVPQFSASFLHPWHPSRKRVEGRYVPVCQEFISCAVCLPQPSINKNGIDAGGFHFGALFWRVPRW